MAAERPSPVRRQTSVCRQDQASPPTSANRYNFMPASIARVMLAHAREARPLAQVVRTVGRYTKVPDGHGAKQSLDGAPPQPSRIAGHDFSTCSLLKPRGQRSHTT